MTDLTIIVPCFNEAENVDLLASGLKPVLGHLRRHLSVEVLFIDDGSTDGTGPLLLDRFAGDPQAHMVVHSRNLGLGAALRTGFRHSRGRVLVTTDSDSTYPYSLIPEMLRYLEPGVDIVNASCYHPQGGVDNVPAYRILLSRAASLMYRQLISREVYTYSCMFRAYRRNVVESVTFESDGFLAVTEILARALLMGYVVREMPCVLRNRRYGASKARIARTVLAHLRFQWRLLWSRRAIAARSTRAPEREGDGPPSPAARA